MNTPKKLTDLRNEDNVIRLKHGEIVEVKANTFFHTLFDAEKDVKVNRLFTEDNFIVFKAYQDSGSEEYLYLIQEKN